MYAYFTKEPLKMVKAVCKKDLFTVTDKDKTLSFKEGKEYVFLKMKGEYFTISDNPDALHILDEKWLRRHFKVKHIAELDNCDAIIDCETKEE